jgi:hypothetical protein
MVFGATWIAPASQTLAEDSYNFEPGGADSEWIVQGDTWIRREELFGNTYPGKTNRLAAVSSGQPSPLDPQLAHSCANR